MRLAVIGTGYVGLVAGAGFADAGNDVVCVDRDADRITRLRRGELPLVEPRLAELVGRNLRRARLAFSTDLTDAVPGADVIVIAVGTPQGDDGAPDLRAIDETARAIGRTLDGPAVIVVKSTVPVGTADHIRALVAAETRVSFAMASNPPGIPCRAAGASSPSTTSRTTTIILVATATGSCPASPRWRLRCCRRRLRVPKRWRGRSSGATADAASAL
jgi:nucleotide sugar dehydrogenase